MGKEGNIFPQLCALFSLHFPDQWMEHQFHKLLIMALCRELEHQFAGAHSVNKMYYLTFLNFLLLSSPVSTQCENMLSKLKMVIQMKCRQSDKFTFYVYFYDLHYAQFNVSFVFTKCNLQKRMKWFCLLFNQYSLAQKLTQLGHLIEQSDHNE